MRIVHALVALATAVTAPAQSPFGAPAIVGRILWPDHDLSKAQVCLYRDREMKDLADSFPTGGEGGAYVALVEPGQYYLMAIVDVNGTGKLDAGDGVGYFADAKTNEPKAIRLTVDGFIADAHIAIGATIGADGKPVPIEGGPAKIEVQPSGLPVSIAGTLTGRENLTAPLFLLLLKADADVPISVVRVAAEAEGFAITTEGGDYHLLAIADVTADGKLGPGDGVGVYGVADWTKPPDALPVLALGDGDEIGGLEIAVTGRLADDGLVKAPGAATGLALPPLPAIVCGSIRPDASGTGPTQLRVSSDPGMREAVAAIVVDADGSFVAALPGGTYYLTAICDRNHDGGFGPGDLVGFHGVADLKAGAPQPLTIAAGAIVTDLEIALVGQVTEDKGLAPITDQPTAEGTTQQ